MGFQGLTPHAHLIVSFSQFFGVFVSLYRLDYTCSEADFTHAK